MQIKSVQKSWRWISEEIRASGCSQSEEVSWGSVGGDTGGRGEKGILVIVASPSLLSTTLESTGNTHSHL